MLQVAEVAQTLSTVPTSLCSFSCSAVFGQSQEIFAKYLHTYKILKILRYKILKILTYEILKILIYGQTDSPFSLSNVQIYFPINTQKIFATKTHQAKVFSLSTLLCLAVLKVLAVEADIASPEMVDI